LNAPRLPALVGSASAGSVFSFLPQLSAISSKAAAILLFMAIKGRTRRSAISVAAGRSN